MNLAEEIKNSYKKGNSLHKLIYINLGAFLGIKLASIFLFLFNAGEAEDLILRWLILPADLSALPTKFWTPISYMFVHQEFLHLLTNLLWLYWLGRIFLEYFNQKQLISLYLLGGLAGGLVYIVSYNIFPAFREVQDRSVLLGASAAVMAIVIAIGTYVPNYIVRIVLVGPVKLKYIAIGVLILSSLLDFAQNPGGSLAHLGGAAMGFLYIVRLRGGKDPDMGFDKFMDWFVSLFKNRSKMKVSHKANAPRNDMDYNARKAGEQKNIDSILEKISKGGYDSLSKKEKEELFRASKKD